MSLLDKQELEMILDATIAAALKAHTSMPLQDKIR
jgi:hypothetical protein